MANTNLQTNLLKVPTPTQADSMSTDAAFIEFLSHASQQLWRETSFARLMLRFSEILRGTFGVEQAVLRSLRVQDGRFVVSEASFDLLPAIPALDEPFVNAAEKMLLQMDLKAQELRSGSALLDVQGTPIHFALLGDPLADWYVLLWRSRVESQQRSFLDVALDFLVKQVQSGFSWFVRLDRTEAMLYRDDLTGLFNNRYLEVALESEIRRASRFQTSFCLLFIDLDNFKGINDQYGHLTGSSVLKQVGDVLREASREVDSVMRYGGDEFIVLLLGANPNTGLLAGERIRRRIEETRFLSDDKKELRLTASIGVAAYPEHALSKDALVKIADESMYKGKRGGKNRVVIFTKEGSVS